VSALAVTAGSLPYINLFGVPEIAQIAAATLFP
jgi:hypothetical protein